MKDIDLESNPNRQPGRWAWFVSEFRRAVVGNRHLFYAGLPALIVSSSVGLFAFELSGTPSYERLAPYVAGTRLGPEPDQGQYDLALLCAERMIQEMEGDPRPRFDYVRILLTKGDIEGARAILAQLAPVDRVGHPPAQLALAKLMLQGDQKPELIPPIERHLERALEAPETADEARILLARIYAATGRAKRAEPYLRTSANRHPELLLALARMERERGDRAAAEADLDTAIRVFRSKAEAEVDNVEARLMWARAVSARSEFPAAISILEAGLARSNDQRYRSALAQTYGAWVRGKPVGDAATAAARLTLVERGLRYDPNNSVLLDELARVIQGGAADLGQIREIMSKQIVDGKSTPATHFVLGLDAFSRGKVDEARLHWEQAFRLDPSAALVANNLAWLLANAKDPDLKRALELADRAVERRPKQPRFRGTRGLVLMKLQRWSEALTDFEASLAGNPDSPQTHSSLAEVYEKLGSKDLAARHRERVKELEKAAAAKLLARGNPAVAPAASSSDSEPASATTAPTQKPTAPKT
jgi:tetratricopeptide (TPR) repeat protein